MLCTFDTSTAAPLIAVPWQRISNKFHMNGMVRSIELKPRLEDNKGMDFISILSIFVLACFVGYYVVWSVTPALHSPLMAVTNAISSVIIVGALIAAAEAENPIAKYLGLAGVVMASINISGGFAVTERMLAMYKKKEKK